MIRVHIQHSRFDHGMHETLVGAALCQALRKAGVPILAGAFAIRGVERGVLTFFEQPNQHVFTWREPDEQDTDEGFKRVRNSDGVQVFLNGQHLTTHEDDDL